MFDGFWYRCEVKHYSIADEWGEHAYSSSEVVWTKFAVITETPKGVWLSYAPWGATNPDYRRCKKGESLSGDQLVMGKSNRQLACPTKEAALQDAIVRKKRHVAGCQGRLMAAEKDLHLLECEKIFTAPEKSAR